MTLSLRYPFFSPYSLNKSGFPAIEIACAQAVRPHRKLSQLQAGDLDPLYMIFVLSGFKSYLISDL